MSTGTISLERKYVVTQIGYPYRYKNDTAQIDTNALKVELSEIASSDDTEQTISFEVPVTSELAKRLAVGTQVSLTISVMS